MLGVVHLLLALQAILVVSPLTENGVLQTKTPSTEPQGFRHLEAHEDPELLNNDVYEVSYIGDEEPLRGTGGHPLYSLDRDDWVRIRDLQVGERLQTADGAVTVEALEKVRDVHRVYNLEVERDHEYLVGETRVRAHNVELFRGMKEASDRLPQTGPSARELGARPGNDIPVTGGMVEPGTGGVSVSPNSGDNLPSHRHPRGLGGTGKDPVWSIDSSDLGDDLIYDKDVPGKHGTIQPSRKMTAEQYQEALGRTRGEWKKKCGA